jgi:hypothetical protein
MDKGNQIEGFLTVLMASSMKRSDNTTSKRDFAYSAVNPVTPIMSAASTRNAMKVVIHPPRPGRLPPVLPLQTPLPQQLPPLRPLLEEKTN